LPQVITAILNGALCPCGEDEKLKGLRRFMFLEEEVSSYIRVQIRESIRDAFLVSELPAVLGTTMNTVYSLVKKELLPVSKTNSPWPQKMVAKKDLDCFLLNYVLLSKVASKLNTDAGFLARLLREQGIQPIRATRKKALYVIKKSDLESINLTRLIADARKQSEVKRKEPKVVGLAKAAEILDVTTERVLQLVENGVLTTYKSHSQQRRQGGLCFLAETVLTYKKQVQDYLGLVTLKVAARMTALSTSGLLSTYVRKGRLRPMNPKGKSKPHFFRKEDVEALAILRKQTIRSPVAAVLLGVNISCIHKLKQSGDLKPASGPNIDGFPVDLYLLDDVEKLCAEREAFKIKRAGNGGSTRFGKPSGPKQRPVRAEVGPRIDQLVKKRRAKNPERRVTGAEVYRQLVKEGYRMGINTIYVHLREQQ
jgi:hypothetical protein